jgi:hypothetical protein
MRSFVLCALALAGLALASAAARADEEKFTIKPHKPIGKGESLKVTDKTAVKAKSTVSDDNGNSMDVNKQLTVNRVYVDKTLEVDAKTKKRTKFTRAYEKATDVEGDESSKKPYHGRTIAYEKSEGKWKLASEGKPELSADDLKDLTEEITRGEKDDDPLYPDKPVKVGDTWKLNGKDVANIFEGLKMNPDTVKGEGKLVKTYKKGDRTWGTLEYSIDFEAKVEIIDKVKSKLKFTLDQPLDGTAMGKAKFELTQGGKHKVEANCMKINVDFKIEAVIDREAEPVKK